MVQIENVSQMFCGQINEACGKIIVVAVTKYFVFNKRYKTQYRGDGSKAWPIFNTVRERDYPDLFTSGPITARVRENSLPVY